MQEMSRHTGKTAGKALKRIFRQDDILSRIEEQPASISMLMNPTRMSIFIHLCQNPCDHTRSIARAMEASLTTVNWHLGRLLECGYLEAGIANNKKLYWPRNMIASGDAEMIGCLRHEIPSEILKIISRNPEPRQNLIVEKMHKKQQNIDFWLGRMEECRIIRRHGKGIGTTYHISEYLTGKLNEYDNLARLFSRDMLELLYHDGLMPKNPRFKGTRMGVDLKLPSGRTRIHLECSALASARRYVK